MSSVLNSFCVCLSAYYEVLQNTQPYISSPMIEMGFALIFRLLDSFIMGNKSLHFSRKVKNSMFDLGKLLAFIQNYFLCLVLNIFPFLSHNYFFCMDVTNLHAFSV